MLSNPSRGRIFEIEYWISRREGVLDSYLKHNFLAILLSPKIIHPPHYDQEKNQLFLATVMLMSTTFLVTFHKYPEF